MAAKWVKNYLKFPVVSSELKTNGSREIPDVLAFRSNTSLIIECKTSKADFRKDFSKPERCGMLTGVGNYRLYCTPEGLLKIEQIPESWGLIEVTPNGKIKLIRFKEGNIYHGNHSPDNYRLTDPYFHISDIDKERSFMYSILTRMKKNSLKNVL